MTEPGRVQRGNLARTTLQLAALFGLVLTAVWILRPFLLAGVWAAMIAIATFPVLLRAQRLLLGRRALAVAALTLALLLVLVVPLYLGVSAIVENVDEIGSFSRSLSTWNIPQPPEWLDGIPLVGAKAADEWRDLAAEGPEALAARVTPYTRDLARVFVDEVGNVGALLLNFLLTVIFCAIFWANGETAADAGERFARRLAGEQGQKAARLAAQAVRAVALGVVLTAVLQTFLVGLGLSVVGVPFAAIFTALSFILAVAQIGPAPILIGAIIWVYSTHGSVWGTGFLLWALLCMTIDNFVRPVLIKRGADLPLLLIFGGVIGGLVAFGVVGLFIGPVVLAVGYMLLQDWLDEAEVGA
ncbi:MAG TPA: AI-2E family transporter YdiK [Myxococcota bacterium]|nr:AI-2E family transporter YdiK [Myxococcota bacterium]